MPVVTIQMWEGRTLDDKRALVRAITDAMVEHAGARPDGLHVIIDEYPRENWGRAGVLGIDRNDRRLAHLLLQVTDLEAAERFYLDVLGLRVRKRERFRDGRPLVVTEEGLGLTSGRPAGEGANVDHVAFHVDGLDELVERARDAGYEVVRGPVDSGYGRSTYLADPDGNEVELIAPAEEGP